MPVFFTACRDAHFVSQDSGPAGHKLLSALQRQDNNFFKYGAGLSNQGEEIPDLPGAGH
jgi:hypothetical protein